MALIAGAVLAGCGSTGPTPAETAALAAAPIPAGKARLTIQRPSSVMYAGAPATITVNGDKVADVATGGSAVVDVPAGALVVAASAWSYPGAYEVKLNAVAGQRYAILVEPRSASLVPGMLGPVGAVIDASANENAGGAFELRIAEGGA